MKLFSFHSALTISFLATYVSALVRLCPEDNGNIDRSGYDICLILDVNEEDVDIFAESAAVWASKITGDLQEVNMPPTQTSSCGAYPNVIDDLAVCAQYQRMDGPGGVLGSAGPTYVRDNGLPVTGEMQFDSADMDTMRREGTLAHVMEHEMGHVIGFGTVWKTKRVTGMGPLCPYLGQNANREWQALSGCTSRRDRAPTEKTGGQGTRCSHWDEMCLQDEIMTGTLLQGHIPLFSTLTIASLRDIGYQVPNDYATVADDFTRNDINPACRCGNGRDLQDDADEELRFPGKQLISEEGKSKAIEWGLDILRHRKQNNVGRPKMDGLRYVGDQFVSVAYMEEDQIFFVEVEPE